MGKKLILILRYTSITRIFIEYIRAINPKRKNFILTNWITRWLIASAAILFFITWLPIQLSFEFSVEGIALDFLSCLIFYIAISRCNEITYAFLQDAFEKLPKEHSTKKKQYPLSKWQKRIEELEEKLNAFLFTRTELVVNFFAKWRLFSNASWLQKRESYLKREKEKSLSLKQRVDNALLSFFEIIINFAIMYRLLPQSAWIQKPMTIVDGVLKKAPPIMNGTLDALYYSVTTITTLGYGDITPHTWIAKLLSMYEVLSGIVLLVFALAVYMTYAGSLKDKKQSDKN